jgi:hypothetical protein
MKVNTLWKSRSTRQIVTLEAYDAHTVVYRQKEGNALTDLIIVSIGEFLTNFMEVES